MIGRTTSLKCARQKTASLISTVLAAVATSVMGYCVDGWDGGETGVEKNRLTDGRNGRSGLLRTAMGDGDNKRPRVGWSSDCLSWETGGASAGPTNRTGL